MSTATVTHLALVGPTATGKSEIAVLVARARGDVEIVSLDSMQVYRGMDIGTAKPTRAQRAEVVHHLIDVAEPSEDWSVVRTQQAARAAVADIEARGKRALLVGGTGLYVNAVVDALGMPPTDPAIRAELETQTQTGSGLAAAYARLLRDDPIAAARIEPGNRRRIVRALEVMRITGRPFSSFGPGLDGFAATAFGVVMAGLWVDRELLAARIDTRIAAMRAAGLTGEVRTLLARNGGLSRTAAQAIGYREVIAHLTGEMSGEDAAYQAAARQTRRFARRQRMWFRRDPRITWLAADPRDTARYYERLARAVLALWDGAKATHAIAS